MVFLFPIAYLPPVSYYSKLLFAEKIFFEKHEHYVKQSYRNRALVYGANGIHPLIIPVVHEGNERKPIAERRISYDTAWQKIHWRTLTSSYRNAPYFEYFEDAFRAFYEEKTETLFDFNFLLIEKICTLMQVPFYAGLTDSYETTVPGNGIDLRNAFAPADRKLNLPEYNQVFADRGGFIPDLSIVDLLFNRGLETKNYLAAISED